MISSTLGCEVRQELYLTNQYEKARQDVGLFYDLSIAHFAFSFEFFVPSGQYWKMLKSCTAATRFIQTYDQFDDVIRLSFKKAKEIIKIFFIQYLTDGFKCSDPLSLLFIQLGYHEFIRTLHQIND